MVAILDRHTLDTLQGAMESPDFDAKRWVTDNLEKRIAFDKEMEPVYRLIDTEELTQARNVLTAIERKYGHNPDTTRASACIAFLG